jgi:hypothetical protein
MIFICWYDYDGNYVEKFAGREEAGDRIAEIKQIKYSTIDLVVEGKELSFEPVEVVTRFKIVDA